MSRPGLRLFSLVQCVWSTLLGFDGKLRIRCLCSHCELEDLGTQSLISKKYERMNTYKIIRRESGRETRYFILISYFRLAHLPFLLGFELVR